MTNQTKIKVDGKCENCGITIDYINSNDIFTNHPEVKFIKISPIHKLDYIRQTAFNEKCSSCGKKNVSMYFEPPIEEIVIFRKPSDPLAIKIIL